MSDDAVVVRGGTVHTQTARGTVAGDVLIEDGEITAVGEVDAPAGAREIDASGMEVTPGLVDAHSHAGMAEWGEPEDGDFNEGTSATTPHVNALDGFHPRDEELRHAYRNGVTTVSARMGSGNVIGGVIVSMKTYGKVADRMLLREDGMKAAMGENPKRFHGEGHDRQPSTRPGVAATLREEFMAAEDYGERKREAERDGEPFERDLGKENLLRVLEGELPLRVHAHRSDDIMTVFRIADEFGIEDLSIEHATEGHVVAEEFVARDVPAVVGPSISSATKYELRNITFETPGILHDAGVTVAIQTDAPILPQKHLDVCVGLAVRNGLPADAALDTVTTNAAEILGVTDRVGTLEPGTDGDVVVWDGPFHRFDTQSQHVVVEGEHVFDRAEDETDPRDDYAW
ncbi:MAG: amidohydrolase family protein [Halobaculum sp.]